MHLTYELKPVKKDFVNGEIQKMLQSKVNDKTKFQKVLQEFPKLIKEIEEEQKKICKVSAKFATFLSHNAIIPYNDGIFDHLNYCIKEEEESRFPDKEKIEKMKKY